MESPISVSIRPMSIYHWRDAPDPFGTAMIISYFALLAALTRAVGDFRDPIYALLTAITLGFFWRYSPAIPAWNRTINWLFRWVSFALFAALLRWAAPPLALALASVAAWLFARYGDPATRAKAAIVALTGALFTIWWTIAFQLPEIFNLITTWSRAYTTWISGAMAGRLILGPSASAVDLLLLGVLAIAAITILERPRRWAYALISIILLEAGRIVYLWLAPTMEGWVARLIPVATTPHLDLPGAYLLFVIAVVWLHWRSAEIVPSESARHAAGGTRTVRWIGAAAIVLALLTGGAASYECGSVRVLVLDRNTLDFTVPAFGRYGDRSGGMFGFLPKFLHEAGFEVKRQDLTPGVLDSVDVVIIANLLEKFTPEERQQMWTFVENGGGLLMLGDHTGTDAIRDPTNDLLSPCGLELNFDTAVPLRRSWASAKSFLFHPVGRSGGIMDGELWLGASINPGPHGEPFLVGRGAFSDPGDLNNKNRAFLGNLAYDPGEPLGDVVLAAAAHWGKGKAVIFGDTSPYQNGTIVRSHSLITRSIRWLARDGWNDLLDRWRTWLLLVLIGLVGSWLLAQSPVRSSLFLYALLIPVAGVSFWSLVPGPRSEEWKGEEYKLALVDVGHGQWFDGMSWEPKSIGGIEFNLMRNGYSMRMADTPSDIDRYNPDLYILFAPTRPITDDTADRLMRFMDRGGWVIVAAGWNLQECVEPILSKFDVAIDNVPLGQVGGTALGDTVSLADAYPISGGGDGAEDLIHCFGYPVARTIKHGQGGLVVIGDSQFFYNKNLEGQNELVVMENVIFFREMLRRTAGTSAP